ncbi:MAG: HPr family phosphocarrier protein [Gammaproteobacteria bacterium]|nr:HPr family phosphocarrier protein [Gammaproteobacteria bacterium]MDP2140223.1 HPr family phosphocarrier protein [Gammaproteobacteria bacterium]MDP2348099.1 HPr family phosphocarrier protein [Gammaproteobacteria bacterium]
MIESTITIRNKAGLHARAAARMVSVSTAFSSTIKVGQDKLVDGKSILSLMMLAASKGTVLNLIIDGVDETAALDAITTLVNNRFDESE